MKTADPLANAVVSDTDALSLVKAQAGTESVDFLGVGCIQIGTVAVFKELRFKSSDEAVCRGL